MPALAPVLLVGGGVAYVATRAPASVPPPGDTTQKAPDSGSTLVQQIAPAKTGRRRAPISMRARIGAVSAFATSSQTSYGGSTVDPEERQKLEQLEAAAEAKFNRLTAEAKAEAAKKLNEQLNLSPPLKGNEDWKTIASVVGGAAGAAAGTYVCGPLCGKVGALVGAYLGAELADLMDKGYDELKSWIASQWDDAVDAIEGYAEDAWDFVNPF